MLLLSSPGLTSVFTKLYRVRIENYLFDEPLAEGGSYPLSGMDAAVNPHGLLPMKTSLSYLTGHDLRQC